MILEPGMKVVCIRNDFEAVGEVVPVVGTVYTVRDVELGKGHRDRVFIRLVEIVNAPQLYDGGVRECSFDALGFRPLRNRSTDITLFKELVDEVKRGKVRKLEEV